MAYEFRVPKDYVIGVLGTAASNSATTLQSPAFTSLPNSFYSTTVVLPLVLHNPSTGAWEEVWVTAHTGSADTVTVERGKNGTTGQTWPANTQVLCAPTTRDGLMVLTRATLPADAHVGLRVALSDEGIVVQKTRVQGWQADVGSAQPADIGPRRGGSNPPANVVILNRSAVSTGSGNTNGSGNITYTYRTPFPNATNAVAASVCTSTSFAIVALEAEDANGFTVGVYNPTTGAKYGAGVGVTLSYVALGY